jgi:hypothetical protein
MAKKRNRRYVKHRRRTPVSTGARQRIDSSIGVVSELAQLELNKLNKQAVAQSSGRFHKLLDEVWTHFAYLKEYLMTIKPVNVVKSFRDLRTTREQVFVEILVSYSLPVPEITSFIHTYIIDDEEAIKEDWVTSAFDLYVTTFYLFVHWHRKNKGELDESAISQFHKFYIQMEQQYLKTQTSGKLLGRLSRLERL